MGNTIEARVHKTHQQSSVHLGESICHVPLDEQCIFHIIQGITGQVPLSMSILSTQEYTHGSDQEQPTQTLSDTVFLNLVPVGGTGFDAPIGHLSLEYNASAS